MDSDDFKGDYLKALRRSTRQAHKNVVFGADVRARSALKRKRAVEKDAVRGSEEKDSDAEDEDTGSTGKISRLQVGEGAENGHENGDESMTVEMDAAGHPDQEQDMNSEDERESCEATVRKPVIEEKSIIRTVRVGNLETEEMKTFLRSQRMQEHRQKPPKVIGGPDTASGSQTTSKEPSRTNPASTLLRPLENRQEFLRARSSIRQYHNKMEEKAKDVSSAGLQNWDRYPYSEGPTKRIPQTNIFPAKKQPLQHRNTELKKPVTTKAASASYSRGYVWYVCGSLQWALFLLASLTLGLLGYQHLPAASFPTKTTQHQDKMVSSANFDSQLAALKPLFPSQHSELWKRSEIHLKQHLKLNDPSQPVSMILTAGLKAEKTLGCLAQRLAAAFSAALNTSMVDIDGASKMAHNSDQVKLDIDIALREAFDGGKQAAVIHRFEELPPGSTLIFYRYCDHENAAYKNVFLVFTVLLPVDELDSKLNLNAVEEKVHEHLKDKFVSTERTAMFNQMDVDKLSGLWSRISHLILPVAAEQTIEKHGCGG
ncbi:torsin-1A-interacting protein 1 isoform X2 [Pygocentrus nattereri]|uniref:torsin-1A-interacting protein 1 isoform X2 n=1 Tax=Pygocentrus nattereri TaxID=42514 RepID=UPI000814AB10|nr:torsin-1A-interacting protein 1 isoform X2 [Pygocentrus nattereri]